MSERRIGCIVEGHGEQQALGVLVRKIALAIDPSVVARLDPIIRRPRSGLLKQGEVERVVELVVRQLGASGGVLILLDADEECPATLGPELLRRVAHGRPTLSVAAVLAKREFEAWFLAAAESLRGHRGLPADLVAPLEPEAVQGAKEWLSARMGDKRAYRETGDQAALCAAMDLGLARARSSSFDKLYRDLERLLAPTSVPE